MYIVNDYVIYEQPLTKMKVYISSIVAVCMQKGRSIATVNSYIYCVAQMQHCKCLSHKCNTWYFFADQMQHLILFCRTSATLAKNTLSIMCNT